MLNAKRVHIFRQLLAEDPEQLGETAVGAAVSGEWPKFLHFTSFNTLPMRTPPFSAAVFMDASLCSMTALIT